MSSRAEFDHYAHNYGELLRGKLRDGFARDNSFYHARKWMLIADFLRSHDFWRSDLTWLDVGCGKGELLSYGRSHFGRVVGCDLSREMIRDTDGIEVHLQRSPTVLPFENESFDFVTAVCVYHHVDEPDRIPLTREIERVLRRDGIFCMIEHNPFNPVTRLIVNRCPVDVDAHLLMARSARRYARSVGLKHLETQYFLYLPEKIYAKIPRMERYCTKLPFGGQYATFSMKCLERPCTSPVL
jgi:SAM-dependent methyltransferase